MTVFNQKMVLKTRKPTGQTDSRNQPVLEDREYPIRGTFWQESREDRDTASEVIDEGGKVGFLRVPGVNPAAGDAIIATVEGESFQWEIIGPPEPKFNNQGKSGRVHHWEARIRSAKA